MKKQATILKNLSTKMTSATKSYKQHELFYGRKESSLTDPKFHEILTQMEQLTQSIKNK